MINKCFEKNKHNANLFVAIILIIYTSISELSAYFWAGKTMLYNAGDDEKCSKQKLLVAF